MVNWNEKLSMFGEEITNKEKAVTLKSACINALGAMFEDERNLEGEEKLKRFKLSLKIDAEGELYPEEIVLLKKCVGKMYAPNVMGLIWSKIDPTTLQ